MVWTSSGELGNILGSLVNWWLGLNLLKLRHHRWFPVGESRLAQTQRFYGRYGYWSLLLSWLPVIGDPITLIAGVMREPFWRFVFIVAIAKTARYVVLAYAITEIY